MRSDSAVPSVSSPGTRAARAHRVHPPVSFTRPALVVGVDFRARSRRAVEHAFGMLACGGVREVHLVHVLDREHARDAIRREAVPEALVSLARDIAPEPRGVAWAHVRDGDVCLEIRRLAFDVGADMIALGDRDRGALDLDRYRPFSVLCAGAGLALEARPFTAARCPDCIRARAVGGIAFCTKHGRFGTAPRRIAPGGDDLGAHRVLH